MKNVVMPNMIGSINTEPYFVMNIFYIYGNLEIQTIYVFETELSVTHR